MDPNTPLIDDGNGEHSLEGTDNLRVQEGDQSAFGAPDEHTPIHEAPAPVKPSRFRFAPLRQLSQKINIYLLLFIFVFVGAVALTVYLFLKDRGSDRLSGTITTQTLSEEALKQLSDTSVNIGNSKQILNVESNAIFGGAVLVRSDLEVGGSIKVSGNLELPGISVSGASRFGQLQADEIAISGNATVQGTLNARSGLSVTGNSTFLGTLTANRITTASLQLTGNLELTHHITAGGPVPQLTKGNALGSGGTASVSGSDTSGSITINTGSLPAAGCFVTITFERQFNGVPHVMVTPIGSAAAALNYYVNRTTTTFSVCTTNAAPAGQTFGFDYVALD